jgi:hypothetical protein
MTAALLPDLLVSTDGPLATRKKGGASATANVHWHCRGDLE